MSQTRRHRSTMEALQETFGEQVIEDLGLNPDVRAKSTFPGDELIAGSIGILDRMARTHVGGHGNLSEDKAEEAAIAAAAALGEGGDDEEDCAACADGRPDDCERKDEDDLDEVNALHKADDGKFAKSRGTKSGSGSYQFSAPNNTRFNKPRVLSGTWNKTDARRGQRKGHAKWDKRSKKPCGRAARKRDGSGSNIRCSDGKPGVPGGLNKNHREESYTFAKPGGKPITELRDLLRK
jgi:hypothetical protein